MCEFDVYKMVKYECPRCKKVFDKKFNYQAHIDRKNPCKISSKKQNLEKPYCEICDT